MTWVDPVTRETGDLITAAIWNQDAVDNPQYLYDNLPEGQTINPALGQSSDVGATVTVGTSYIGGTRHYWATGSDGVTLTLSFVLAAGTYSIHTIGQTWAAGGKVDYTLDGVSIATGQDWYSSSTVTNVKKVISGVTVTGSGRHLLVITVNGKNASSSGYQMVTEQIWLAPAFTPTQGV